MAGETLEVEITNFREVQWDTFQPNFFLVFPPGLLDQATGTYMTSVYLTAEQRRSLVELVRRFPSVSIFDVDAMLKQVREVMDKASLAVQYVFLFTLLSGITVLLAAIQATRDERRYESAMLRTLGATRRTVLQGVAAEFVALGLLSGVLGALGATVAGYFMATRLFETADTRRNLEGFSRGFAFAGLPRLVLALGFTDALAGIAAGIMILWFLAAAVLAIRASLDLKALRAFGAAGLGLVVAVVLFALSLQVWV